MFDSRKPEKGKGLFERKDTAPCGTGGHIRRKNKQGDGNAPGSPGAAGKHAMRRKTFGELQIKDDFMFSVIMRNPGFCKPFLERVLGVGISRRGQGISTRGRST